MPAEVQLVRLRPPTEIEQEGSVEDGVVETEAVAWASRLRYDLRVLALPRASMETAKEVTTTAEEVSHEGAKGAKEERGTPRTGNRRRRRGKKRPARASNSMYWP